MGDRAMRIAVLPLALVSAASLILPATAQDKPIKYEYAELRYSRGFVAPGPGAFPGGPQPFPGAGAPGFPGAPGAGAGAGLPATGFQTTIKWTTGEEELVVKDWDELGEELKAPSPKKESPQTVHKLRVLNKLSADGWELLDRPQADAMNGVWTFRRRLP
jgi:hypothetical protein